METPSCKLLVLFPILFILLSTLSQPSSSSSSPPTDSILDKDPSVTWHRRTLLAGRRNDRNRIPNCGEMVSRSQCLQNPKCRWCRSEALDDTCFTKAEAWRLPQQANCRSIYEPSKELGTYSGVQIITREYGSTLHLPILGAVSAGWIYNMVR